MVPKLVLAVLLSFLAMAAMAEKYPQGRERSEAMQCQLQRITKSQPSYEIQCEGGVVQLWDPEEDQFQCAGVAPMRFMMKPNSLALPKFFPAPRLIFIEEGRGLLGLAYPGCPEQYHSEQQFPGSERGREGSSEDQHQQVLRVERGDVVAIPHGVVHWAYNDGNENLITVSILDLNSQNNQLDQNLRAFLLAGGCRRPRESQGSQKSSNYRNILQAFDEDLLAEAWNVPNSLVRKVQQDDYRGLIALVRQDLRIITPGERQGQRYEAVEMEKNGVEETICNMKIKYNAEPRREADVYTRQAGRINIVNEEKLPILRFLDLSAERGNLMPNALHTPHWSMTDHRAIYALRGELHVQIVNENGDTIMDERVQQGDMFVIPQFFATVARAGTEGFEWISFKTNSRPMKSTLAGYTSVTKAMPLDVLSTSYQISPREADQMKKGRDPRQCCCPLPGHHLEQGFVLSLLGASTSTTCCNRATSKEPLLSRSRRRELYHIKKTKDV